jgi:hypothetical protein
VIALLVAVVVLVAVGGTATPCPGPVAYNGWLP